MEDKIITFKKMYENVECIFSIYPDGNCTVKVGGNKALKETPVELITQKNSILLINDLVMPIIVCGFKDFVVDAIEEYCN